MNLDMPAKLIRRGDGEPPTSYPIDGEERKRAVAEALETAARLAEEWRRDVDFARGAPRPEPELRVRPRI